MSWWKGARVRLRAWLRRDAVERELDEELRWHLDMETERYVRQGLARQEARRRALLGFGGVEQVREEHRDVRGMRWPERLASDLRWAVRGLARSKAFTLAAVLTLALGIGANAAAFGVVDALLYRPPAGVGGADDLYRVRLESRLAMASHPEVADLRERLGAQAEIAAHQGPLPVILGEAPEAREVPAMTVSANYFSVLRVEPALGSFWTAGDDRAEEAVVVLGHDFWRRELGGDPGVIGDTLEVSEVPVTIVGVAPPHFKGIDLDPVDLWLPSNVAAGTVSREALEARNIYGLWMVARPASGVAPGAVAARATEALRELAQEVPPSMEGEVELVPVIDRFPGDDRASPVPAWLLGVTAVVLLIACANVSNLLLARGAGRRRELAIRAALGASRLRIVRLLLAESLLLASLGGAAGVVLAAWSARLLPLFDLPPLDPLIDGRTLAFSLVVAVGTSLLVGSLPALRLSRGNLESVLKAATPRATHDRSRLRAALTVAQVALSVVLLVNAGLFVRSLGNVRALDASFDLERLLVVSSRFQRGTAPERVRAAQEAGRERLAAMPGVESVSLASDPPYRGPGMVNIGGASWGLPEDPPTFAASLFVDAGYFDTVGLALRAGRLFDGSDRAGSAPVMIVNAELARRLGGEATALGRCVGRPDNCSTIVGVVAGWRFMEPLEEPVPAIYRPLARQAVTRSARNVLLVRAGGSPPDLAEPIRAELMRDEPALQFVEVESATERLRPKLQPWRIAMGIFTLFGGLAMLLATIGLYAVIAYLVAARRPELGVRMALGASRGRIRGLVVGEGARLVALGGVVGMALALGVSRALEHRLYGVQPTDPLTYGGMALLMVAVALAASLVSAERAARVDPSLALRAE